MPTRRYYFRKTQPAPVSPSTGPWSRPGDVQRVAMTQTNFDPNTGQTGDFSSHLVSKVAEGGQTVLIDQYVADDTLPAGPVSGTFTIVQGTGQPGFPTDMVYRVVIRVVSNDGATVRGTLYSGPGLPVSTDPMSDRAQASTSSAWVRGAGLIPVTAQAGDRLVVEVGYESAFAYGWPNWTLSRGAPNRTGAGVDLSAVDREVSQLNLKRSWIEFNFPEPPNGPRNVRQTGASSTSIDVEWDAPAIGTAPMGYEYRLDGGAVVPVGLSRIAEIGGLSPSTTYLVEVRSVAATGRSTWASVAALTGAAKRPAPGIASQAVLSLAGLDPDPEGPDAEAQQWHDVDRADVATYSAVRSRGLVSYSIGYGSRDPLGKPGPVTVSVVLLVPVDDAVKVGDRFKLRLSPSLAEALGTDRERATAIVTDAQADPTRSWVLPHHGPSILWTVTATGWLARYGAASIDGSAWPTEPVGARIGRILGSLGLAGDVDATGPVVLAPRTVSTHHAHLAAATDSTLGRMVEQRDGMVDYHDQEDRRGRPVTLTLDAGEILADGFTWRQSVADVVNEAEISYGLEGGAKVSVVDAESADPRRGVGPYPATISTVLANLLDATDLASNLVGRRAWPYYQLPAVVVDLARSNLDAGRVGTALSVANGDRVALRSMPPGSPWDTLPRGCFIEGYTETATPFAWRLTLVVSDPALSGVDMRWIDVDESVAWDHVNPDLTWADLARLEESIDLL